MRTASDTTRSGQLRSRTGYLPPLDSASQHMERDADATMTAEEGHGYIGFMADPDRQPKPREAAQEPH
jgi:hypothetical protein